MKYLLAVFSSSRTMVVLLGIFAFSIATATFVERNAGTETAQALIYHAKWFELLLLLGAINIIAVILKRKLYRREKFTIFLFHLSFIVILTGAAFTRYVGKEGSMSIREGQTTNMWYTNRSYISVKLSTKENKKVYRYPVLLSAHTHIRFRHCYRLDGHHVKIKIRQYLPRAEKFLVPDPKGLPYIHLVTSANDERKDLLLTLGDSIMIGTAPLVFAPSYTGRAINRMTVFANDKGSLSFRAPYDILQTSMNDRHADTLKTSEVHDIIPMMIYNLQGIPVLILQYMPNGSVTARSADNTDMQLPSAMVLEVKCDQTTRDITIWEQKTQKETPTGIDINGLQVSAWYGLKPEVLPFSLTLDDFILKRYPGSQSPSWFESDVRLADPERNTLSRYRIYMNHILKYRGYRFYQSSFDDDEKGTLLSLNHDGLGTTVTYAGYILLVLGIISSLLNKKSRFRSLIKKPLQTRNMLIIIIGGLLFSFSASYARADTGEREDIAPVIDKDHAREFGRMLIQVSNGRIVPMNTLSSEILRKVARKENYKGQNPDQVMLGMLVYPGIWQHEPVIRISNPELRKVLGIHSAYAAFTDFFSGNGNYILKIYVDEAYRKRPANRRKFDNEVIRTDERLNILYLVFTKEILNILPEPGSINHTWYSPSSMPGDSRPADTVFTHHIADYFFEEVARSMKSRNWKIPGDLLKAIYTFQKKYDASVLPSSQHAKTEILYNQLNPFNRLIKPYMLAGIFLLLLQFIHIFAPRFSIRFFSKSVTVFVSVAFAFHTLGLVLRWYVSGHAPISNGFETLTFIAWATVLAGLLMTYKSSVTISTTSILAALILQIAHLSWMDPQITNLVPVLRSYWLVIHVAVVTTSYGFLGMGTLLAVINLLLMFFESRKNHGHLEAQIDQITQIIKVTLIAGLYLLTIGSFLGGVWANESWGRYWGWDPKETWALVTILVYAFILHMHMVPGMKGRLIFNILSLLGFSSVLMTYFGVNYYLSGLHSYAGGDPMPVPPVVHFSLLTVFVLVILSSAKQYYLRRSGILRSQEE
jgi:cytochrome c-type biogenesis protein CcsB